MGFVRPLESFIGMFQRLFGMLVSGLVIFFSVMRGGRTVGVCGEFVVFGSSLVRVAWHSVSYPWSPLHLGTIRFSKLYNKEHSGRGHAFSNQMKNGCRVDMESTRATGPAKHHPAGDPGCFAISTNASGRISTQKNSPISGAVLAAAG